MFVILQKYDFSSKSQHIQSKSPVIGGCLWYCKSTIFQANHNHMWRKFNKVKDVCDTAKVRFFKQITTTFLWTFLKILMFVILQKYDFSSKSQLCLMIYLFSVWCLWYCKSTIFQANHNHLFKDILKDTDVCDTAKVRFFKQITTLFNDLFIQCLMFVILQKYDFSSKSQPPF